MQKLDPASFYEKGCHTLVVDVRSPGEFAKGHIPRARSLPLFEDDERALIGTLYKQRGRDEAIQAGLGVVGPKMAGYVEQLKKMTRSEEVCVHCWRGGMRSESMGWLFETAGFRVYLLEGGYKAWRQYARESLGKDYGYLVLGGMTGSGKTRWLEKLAEAGEQVINLEALARHKGSVFGSVGMGEQPSNEQFENELFDQVYRLDTSRVTWLEDESRQIGRVVLPETFYRIKSQSRVLMIRVPDEMRIRFLLEDYSGHGLDVLRDPVLKLARRLGGDRTKEILNALDSNKLDVAARLLLYYYYDGLYRHGLSKRKPGMITELDLQSFDEGFYIQAMLEAKSRIFSEKNGEEAQ